MEGQKKKKFLIKGNNVLWVQDRKIGDYLNNKYWFGNLPIKEDFETLSGLIFCPA